MTITGDFIKKLRMKHDMTQAEIAKIAQVSDRAVSAWERGLKEPRMGAIQRLANHFGLKNSDFINGREDIPKLYNDVEKQLIDDFRQLSDEYQQQILMQVKLLKQMQELAVKEKEDGQSA